MKMGYVFLLCLSVWVAGYIGHKFNSIRIKDLERECQELRRDVEREKALVRILTMQSGVYAKSFDFYKWGSLLRDSGIIGNGDLDSNLRLIFRLENLDGITTSTLGFQIPVGTALDILRENLQSPDSIDHDEE